MSEKPSNMRLTRSSISLALAGAFLTLTSFTPHKTEPMRLAPPDTAPCFTTTDINGSTLDLSAYKGQRVLLTFYRNVGCPICNLRFHEIEERTAEFKAKGLVVIAVYESSAANMRSYMEGERFNTIMVPDPEQRLYALYNVERSSGKLMKGMFHGAMGKMMKGKKLFKQKVKQDGHMNRVSADFLINADGTLNTAYYGAYVGDHLSVDSINTFLAR